MELIAQTRDLLVVASMLMFEFLACALVYFDWTTSEISRGAPDAWMAHSVAVILASWWLYHRLRESLLECRLLQKASCLLNKISLF